MDQYSGEKSTPAPPPYTTGPGPQGPPGPPPGFYPPPQGAYPPPQGSYPPPPMVTTTTVYPGTVTVVSTVTPMGSKPSAAVCKSCNMEITTVVKHKSTTKTHLFALLLCVFGLWPCVCIPYCMDSCQNADHYCPNCQAYLGSYLG
ncbi:lipopolysaccharide-induced tumor necrosis factor-alpha factor homolog [Ostrinia furnacalis]|uniref:lipopolysaccharide-induced tumor necrosis factor-alpha factor homolog n=1 Tax=Ostrinia furnacalis TaxID=93504 RepID=UPI00103CC64A|nr:lipopolysaccharide-induced tumor necrosis factor-alpha factor homolog [Ostrinia furnacalis]